MIVDRDLELQQRERSRWPSEASWQARHAMAVDRSGCESMRARAARARHGLTLSRSVASKFARGAVPAAHVRFAPAVTVDVRAIVPAIVVQLVGCRAVRPVL